MEFLTILLDIEFYEENLMPIYKTDPMVTHLLYADDILIMTKACDKSAYAISSVMQRMHYLTGLEMNENKSCLYFSKGARNKQSIMDIIKIKSGHLPIIYLGIPLSHNKLKARDFGHLIDKINKKNHALE